MNDIEERIRNLPWRKPSSDLGERIFAAPESQSRLSNVARGKISWKWAAALAAAAGVTGLIAGTFMAGKDEKTVSAASDDFDMQVVERSSKQNSFDFSEDVVQILPGEFVAYIDSEEDE